MRVVGAIALAALCSGACAEHAAVVPTAVSSARSPELLRLEPGRYWLEIFAIAIADRPMPTCRLDVLTTEGAYVTTPVQLVSDGADWVATSVAGSGSLELSLKSSARPQSRGISLTGTLRGEGRDVSPFPQRVAYGTRVIVDGPGGEAAMLEGTGSPGSSYLSGEVVGVISFADSVGTTATCPTARWSLQPAAGNGARSAVR